LVNQEENPIQRTIPNFLHLKNYQDDLMENQICEMCGSCCKAIILGESRDSMRLQYWKEHKSNNHASNKPKHDKDFILKYWRPITLKEAIKRNPILKEWNLDGGFAYECTLLKDGKCSSHDDRPKVCKDFPFYYRKKKYAINYNPNCSYMKGLKDKIKPTNPYFEGLNIESDFIKSKG